MPPKHPLSPPDSSASSTPVSSPISKMNRLIPSFLTLPFNTIVEKHAKIDALERYLRSLPNATHSHPIAHARDRYTDIKPWTNNAISLHTLSFPYINASPITLGRENEKFIATQGPLSDEVVSDSFEHFWEMCWQEGNEIVVMLTGAVEGGKEKCGVYYPLEVGEVKVLNDWGSVESVSQFEESRTEVRELKLRKRVSGAGEEDEVEVEERTVWHFLFLAWPDHGVPNSREDVRALLELVKMTRFRTDNKSVARKEVLAPRIVHCSAGVGRTGTFIALDHLLQDLENGAWKRLTNAHLGKRQRRGREGSAEIQQAVRDDLMEGAKAGGELEEKEEEGDKSTEEEVEDPIFDTVMKLRKQRVGMVYQPSQYAFIYRVLREKWQAQNQIAVNIPTAAEAVGDTLESPTKKRKLSLASLTSQLPNYAG